MSGDNPVKPSIPTAICLGPVPLSETEDYGAYSEERKIKILQKFARAINTRERALWVAAERLSDFGEGQPEIYGDLLKIGRGK